MPKANNRNIYEERPWLNDDVQNRTVLRQIVGGGSDITVEEITITENDTYIAPEGKAYSPVIVNVAGGSSDFSTATVTVIATSNMLIDFNGGFPEEANVEEQTPAYLSYSKNVELSANDAVELIVALYKGTAMISCELPDLTSYVTSGDIQDFGEGVLVVTGDGTVTFSIV